MRNWGTFTGPNHYVLDAQCGATCLTGLNRSGKSTLVDALLTLLVPYSYRNYNVAATETGSKRERSIKTYIQGAYGKQESQESAAGQTLFLRRPGEITILLAVFYDQLFGQYVTLAQLHWVTASGDHHARYLIKEADIHIDSLGIANLNTASFASHFQQEEWFYETTEAPYQGKLQGLLRIPDPKALRLFCRTVSMKEVRSVTEFIRGLMLEPHDSAGYLRGIETHFQDLHSIYQELLETKRQIALLEPIETVFGVFREASDAVELLNSVSRATKVIISRRAGEEIDREKKSVTTSIKLIEAEVEQLDGQLELIEKRLQDIAVAKDRNETFKAIETLKAEEAGYRNELVAAETLVDNLHQWLPALRYSYAVDTAEAFARLQEFSTEMKESGEKKFMSLTRSEGAMLAKRDELRGEQVTLKEEMDEIRLKRTKIHKRNRDMRDEICANLQIEEGLLPFAGELMDVPESEQQWRHSIEVLIHGFAQSVIVPENIYPRVSGYVENSRFRKRFTYFKAYRGKGLTANLEATRVFGKIQIREDAWCRAWLLERLTSDYDHLCCNSELQFREARGNAITRNLHVRTGLRIFKESPDSLRDFDVLGWSNESKIQWMLEQWNALKTSIAEIEESARNASKDAQSQRIGSEVAKKICEISDFRKVDVESIKSDIEIAVQRREEIEANDDAVKAILGAEKEARDEKKAVGSLRDQKMKEKNSAETKKEKLKETRRQFATRFNNNAEDFDWKAYESEYESRFSDLVLDVTTIENQFHEAVAKVKDEIEEKKTHRTQAANRLTGLQATFLTEMRDKGFTADWSTTPASAPAMVDHLTMLRNERFHSQQEEFKAQMHRVMFEDLSIGSGDLRGTRNANHNRIEELNRTLRGIAYTEGTYIQIVTRDSKDPAVTTFRAKLSECVELLTGTSDEQLEKRFEKIEALIHYIRERRAEAEKGANPNNWDTFALVEHEEDHREAPPKWHADSGGGSGGQKAKLACTIVAAAMAFRMGHSKMRESKAFRLVMVDEIFAKSDDVNSAYALSIFERFDFQLLLVTPRDGRLKMVIPYVQSFHLAQNPEENSSSIASITQEEALNADEYADA